jgi:spore maturation protein CgeB
VTNYTPGLEKLFDLDSEIVTYRNIQELDEKIDYYLKNETERIKVETAGYQKSVNKHTYFHRSQTLHKLINEL